MLRIVYDAPLPRAPLTRLHPAFSPFGRPVHLIASPAFDSFAPAHSGIRPAHCAALSAGSELVVLVFEQDVECGERPVTTRDILLQVELVRIAQFAWHAVASRHAVALREGWSAKEGRSHHLLENSQIIPNHDDFVEESSRAGFLSAEANVPQAV